MNAAGIPTKHRNTRTFVVGDVHGTYDRFCALIQDADLVGPDLRWNGGHHRLWLLGDLVDRGTRGLEVLDLTMRLQREAAAAGGHVGVLLGNHEVHLLAAHRFKETYAAQLGETFSDYWRRNGGHPADLAGLTEAQAAWLAALPVLALVGDHLLLHADSPFYLDYGSSVEKVNTAIRAVLADGDGEAWAMLLARFAERRAFAPGSPERRRAAVKFLRRFGVKRLVHGHTPIPSLDGAWSAGPLSYWQGRCTAVDALMWADEPGCFYRVT